MSDGDRRTLPWIAGKDHKNTAPKITTELHEDLENPVFAKKDLHKAGFHGRAAIEDHIK